MDAAALTCPQCGAAAAADAIECSFCHARLATTACPSCFGLVFVGSKHCAHCGAAITAVEAQASALPCPRGCGTLRALTLGGVALNFTKINAIEALFWSAVINGVIAVPIMAVMMYLGAQPSVLGDFVIRKRLKRLGWLATVVMAIAVLAMLVTMLL